ncbi:hypothetical protein GOBAR_AA04548 [Gossypium barbadense]|uniref:Uncharacterized protein n=1 Tax=Gossypium barbadense TaxID=3634 RepID=A0A2P5YK98_GOSBA|nr:hypothetical protein GOBAR_AA04548 [Gossypium barbadense]
MAIQEALRPDAINGDMATDLDGSVASRWLSRVSLIGWNNKKIAWMMLWVLIDDEVSSETKSMVEIHD